MLHKLCAFCGAVLAASTAGASSGLTLIPIADILRHREASASVGLSGTEQNISKGYSFSNSATIGLFDRVELGYGNDFLGTTLADAKLMLFESHHAALSIGASAIDGRRSEPYVVARYDLPAFRVHGGFWNTGGLVRPMIGIDFPFTEAFSGSLEYLGGPDGVGAATLNYSLPWFPGVGVSAAVTVPANGRDGIGHSLSVSYSFRF